MFAFYFHMNVWFNLHTDTSVWKFTEMEVLHMICRAKYLGNGHITKHNMCKRHKVFDYFTQWKHYVASLNNKYLLYDTDRQYRNKDNFFKGLKGIYPQSNNAVP